MQPVVPSRTQILRLYRKYLTTAQSFSSYNFRTYFLRRSRDMFRSALLPQAQAAQSSPFSKQGSATAKVSPSTLLSPDAISTNGSNASGSNGSIAAAAMSDQEKLATFYNTALEDLKVLQRSAITNRLYEGERLVVEQPKLIVGGGGAGAEASVGGGGQPTQGPQSPGGAPQSD
ncbi:uncharacterized protein PFL1_01740 [Pseudozyma flocculosa PF-1]|uniref:Complex 1 LYR protein domain-containing protein n=1 Tax=Pseudozyma flocculosa TaxID=84751 RepID=A0A5C3EYP7_9BASI|nr:uncharacterized protein PFL1_01740 [Pseudozyma flocculosa PF-1]EPQ30842.1 hypothetical protein PFL1_01740 [Pseudozyma flocculosa PF-1]SPO36786.1 uncharacterized protein PSFLO_02257 [Pseudozyma flocculosa]